MTLSAPRSFQGVFLTGSPALHAYGEASGPVALEPRAAAVPRNAGDVSLLLEWAGERGLPLVARGAGTGMPGGNVGTGVAVDLSELDTLDPVDPRTRTVRVGAGVVAAAVDRAAARHGLRFPPLPSSADRCTVGGMIANNAAGARSFLHGSMREWVVELEVVTADGSVHRLGREHPVPDPFPALRAALVRALGSPPAPWPRVRKNSSGYALDRFLPSGEPLHLLVGSEGTLGLVTGAVLRLVPEPAARGVRLLALPELDRLPGAVDAAREVGASACEYLGRRILEMGGLEEDPEFGDLARGADALLLVEVEGTGEEVARGMEALQELARSLGSGSVAARDREARERLWELRHRASPTIREAAQRGLHSMQFIEDSVVPVEHLPAYVQGLRTILDRAGTDAVVFGHAGDGNLHVNPLVDVSRDDWRERVRRVLDETAELVGGLGGTLSGEHGDGRVRAPLLDRIWPAPVVDAFRTVKETLDPAGLLNPGVVLPLPGQDPLDGLGARLEA